MLLFGSFMNHSQFKFVKRGFFSLAIYVLPANRMPAIKHCQDKSK
jgi:hypothetical protein